jgi:hypothetical protein
LISISWRKIYLHNTNPIYKFTTSVRPWQSSGPSQKADRAQPGTLGLSDFDCPWRIQIVCLWGNTILFIVSDLSINSLRPSVRPWWSSGPSQKADRARLGTPGLFLLLRKLTGCLIHPILCTWMINCRRMQFRMRPWRCWFSVESDGKKIRDRTEHRSTTVGWRAFGEEKNVHNNKKRMGVPMS